ncbi:MAG: hypothetical protein Kow0075_03040 [Salibacteraceae bacterium]
MSTITGENISFHPKSQMKKGMKILATILVLLTSASLFAQNATNEAGRRHGKWVITGADENEEGYDADDIIAEGEYDNGRKVGVWKEYYPSGKLKAEITYVSGRPRGPYKRYYENGQVEEEGNWELTKQTGTFKRYYENGQVAQEFNFDPSGKRTGRQVYYYENGQVMIEGNWNGGKEDGEIKEYFEDGSVKSVRVFNGGEMDENKSTFNAPKTPAQKPEPLEAVKTENNKIKVSEVVSTSQEKPNIGYFNGNGQHTLYNKNRQVAQKGEFKNGRLWNGQRYVYDNDGLLIKIEVYNNGVYVGDAVIPDELKN